MYNKTIKDSLNLPLKAPHEKIDILMGVQNAKNIVQSSYLRNHELWEKEFLEEDDVGQKCKETRTYIDEQRD